MAQELSGQAFWLLVALAGGRKHGYGLIEEVSRLSEGRITLKVATLYTTLDRLAEGGLVVGDGEEVVAGRRRRYFRLTSDGAAALDTAVRTRSAEAAHGASRLRSFGWATDAGTATA